MKTITKIPDELSLGLQVAQGFFSIVANVGFQEVDESVQHDCHVLHVSVALENNNNLVGNVCRV